jgi:hypothetical protein
MVPKDKRLVLMIAVVAAEADLPVEHVSNVAGFFSHKTKGISLHSTTESSAVPAKFLPLEANDLVRDFPWGRGLPRPTATRGRHVMDLVDRALKLIAKGRPFDDPAAANQLGVKLAKIRETLPDHDALNTILSTVSVLLTSSP